MRGKEEAWEGGRRHVREGEAMRLKSFQHRDIKSLCQELRS